MPTPSKIYKGSTLIYDGSGTPASDPSDQYPSPFQSNSNVLVTCTASSTVHTVGSWAEVTASMPADCAGIVLFLDAATGAAVSNTSTLLEIGTGGPGAETVWATIPIGYWNSPRQSLAVPGYIAAGTRVVVRARSAVSSKQVSAIYYFLPVKSAAPAAPTSLGIVTSTSRGTAIATPGSLNTKGAWTEISASAGPFDIIGAYIQGQGGTVQSAGKILLDIGIGGSGAETVLIPNIEYDTNVSELIWSLIPNAYGVTVPSSSRLSARFSRSATGILVDASLIGA